MELLNQLPTDTHQLLLICFMVLAFTLNFVEAFPKTMQFELPDKEEMCFYHDFDDSEKYVLEFRVVRGGKNDVDVRVKSPNGKDIFFEKRQHYGSHEFEVSHGTYSFCFGNRFSTVTHKQVYFSIHPKKLDSLALAIGNTSPQVLTMMESLMENLHVFISSIEDMQTAFRLREYEGRSLSEDLNLRVNVMSIILTIVAMVAGFGQVTLLKTFFSDKKSTVTGVRA